MMRECICAQCTEAPGDFRYYSPCDACGFFGHADDDFPDGSTVCFDCIENDEEKSE